MKKGVTSMWLLKTLKICEYLFEGRARKNENPIISLGFLFVISTYIIVIVEGNGIFTLYISFNSNSRFLLRNISKFLLVFDDFFGALNEDTTSAYFQIISLLF